MNNKEQPTMRSVASLTKFLIDVWRESRCPNFNDCIKCNYKELCTNIEELAKVVNK